MLNGIWVRYKGCKGDVVALVRKMYANYENYTLYCLDDGSILVTFKTEQGIRAAFNLIYRVIANGGNLADLTQVKDGEEEKNDAI